LDTQLANAAMGLATDAGRNLYDAGIAAAQGLVDGLQAKQNEIRAAMERIANSMIQAIKSQLGIRSPSRIFAEIGKFSVQGMADGIRASSKFVRDAATSVGNEAADALTNSLANISDRIQNDIDTDLTITPVLDLSQVQKDASQIQGLADVIPITAATSFGQAAAISQESQVRDTQVGDAKIIEFNFEQNNTSPKTLDDVEIYRQTNNQLAQVKSTLGLTK
jgi:hypothetical protein